MTYGAANAYDQGYGVVFNTITTVNTVAFNAIGQAFQFGTHITTTQANIIGVAWPVNSALTINSVYNVGYSLTTSTNALAIQGSGNTLSIQVTSPFGAANAFTMNTLWVRARIYPPNDILLP